MGTNSVITVSRYSKVSGEMGKAGNKLELIVDNVLPRDWTILLI